MFTCIYTYEIYLETLLEIKKNINCKIINWSSDDSWRYNQHTSLLLNGYDVSITSHWQSHLKNKKKLNSIYTSWGCPDHWKANITRAKKCKYNVSFVGNSYMDRKKYIKAKNDAFDKLIGDQLSTGISYSWTQQYNAYSNNLFDMISFAQSREREADIEVEMERLETIDKMDDSELTNPELDAIMNRIIKTSNRSRK